MGDFEREATPASFQKLMSRRTALTRFDASFATNNPPLNTKERSSGSKERKCHKKLEHCASSPCPTTTKHLLDILMPTASSIKNKTNLVTSTTIATTTMTTTSTTISATTTTITTSTTTTTSTTATPTSVLSLMKHRYLRRHVSFNALLTNKRQESVKINDDGMNCSNETINHTSASSTNSLNKRLSSERIHDKTNQGCSELGSKNKINFQFKQKTASYTHNLYDISIEDTKTTELTFNPISSIHINTSLQSTPNNNTNLNEITNSTKTSFNKRRTFNNNKNSTSMSSFSPPDNNTGLINKTLNSSKKEQMKKSRAPLPSPLNINLASGLMSFAKHMIDPKLMEKALNEGTRNVPNKKRFIRSFSAKSNADCRFDEEEYISSTKSNDNKNNKNNSGKNNKNNNESHMLRTGVNFERRKAICDMEDVPEGSDHLFQSHMDTYKRERKQSSAELGMHYPGDLLTQARPRRMAIDDFPGSKGKQASMMSLLLTGEQDKKSKTPFSLIKKDKKLQARSKSGTADLADLLHSFKRSEFSEDTLMRYKDMKWHDLLTKNSPTIKVIVDNASDDAIDLLESNVINEVSRERMMFEQEEEDTRSYNNATCTDEDENLSIGNNSDLQQHRYHSQLLQQQLQQQHQQHKQLLLAQLNSKEIKRREAVWELFTSECVFLVDYLMVLKHVGPFRVCKSQFNC